MNARGHVYPGVPGPRAAPAPAAARRVAKAHFRRARIEDAVAIGERYRLTYRSDDGRDPTEIYPYPQVMDPRWVRATMAEQRVCWVVAEVDGKIAGAVAAHHCVASSVDRIAEYFGLVVDPEARARGLARGLLRCLSKEVDAAMEVAIGEMRTADPHAARVVERCGLHPLGYEPLVHTMLDGAESMIVVGELSADALRRRAAPRSCTPRVARLAEVVLAGFGLSRPRARTPEPRRLIVPTDVYALRRLRPVTPRGARTQERQHIPRVGDREVGRANLQVDWHDSRIRVHGLTAGYGFTTAELLEALLDDLRREARGAPFVVSLSAPADRVALQTVVEAQGFRPNVYFPALLDRGGRRRDVVQYIRAIGCRVEDTLDCLEGITWPRARAVVGRVAALCAEF